MKTKTTLFSRDVTFHENIFPYHLHPTHIPIPLLFYLPIPSNLPSLILYSRDTSPTPNPTASAIPAPIPTTPLPITSYDPIPSNTPLSPTSLLSLSQSSSPIPQRTTRPHKPPSYLQQYVLNIVTSTPSSHHSFVEPQTYKAAIQDPMWIQAINNELDALQANNTWDLVPLPSGKNPLVENGGIRLSSIPMDLWGVSKHVLSQRGIAKSMKLIIRRLFLQSFA